MLGVCHPVKSHARPESFKRAPPGHIPTSSMAAPETEGVDKEGKRGEELEGTRPEEDSKFQVNLTYNP